ncbi:P-loop containing nucleoside triphosphate hydrolase [Phytophthora cactorum]|nr:P-loop containing nucleoside triphosphate hydrolase [Phytophthora cactorum]
MALLLGPRNAGKTSFFHLIRDGKHVDTVSSMKDQTFRFMVHPNYNPDKFDAELTVVDYPGHERLRSRVAEFYPVAGCIAFFVDASDVPSFRQAAEFLYDIFANKKVNDQTPPIMVVCNKSEASGAASPQAVRDALEKELTQLKTTRSSLETEGDDDEQDLSQVPVGRDGASFEFDVDSPCEISFVKCSVKDADIHDVLTGVLGSFLDVAFEEDLDHLEERSGREQCVGASLVHCAYSLHLEVLGQATKSPHLVEVHTHVLQVVRRGEVRVQQVKERLFFSWQRGASQHLEQELSESGHFNTFLFVLSEVNTRLLEDLDRVLCVHVLAKAELEVELPHRQVLHVRAVLVKEGYAQLDDT